MTREEAHALVDTLLGRARRRDASGVAMLYASDAVAVSPVFGEVRGRAAIADTWQRLFATLGEVVVEVSDLLVDGDRVAVMSTVETTDLTGWFGLPATGRAIRYRLVLLLTTKGGQIVRDERLYDSTGVLERLEKARVDKELRTAADVQRALSPRAAHVGPFFESVGDSIPCRAIGGDFFEFVDLPNGDASIVMGDVSGKGPPAALLAAMLQGMLAVEAPECRGPADTLTRVNRQLAARRLEPRFATVVYGVLSRDGRFTYANAGHNPPAALTRNGVRRLTIGGPILGVFAEARFEEETLQLSPDDILMMFTDGVTEARNGAGDEFGEDRLIRSLDSGTGAPLSSVLAGVFAAVRTFCQDAAQSDDITVTATRFRAAPGDDDRTAAGGN
jgi:phosphoserine phosphatase RsbU/P